MLLFPCTQKHDAIETEKHGHSDHDDDNDNDSVCGRSTGESASKPYFQMGNWGTTISAGSHYRKPSPGRE